MTNWFSPFGEGECSAMQPLEPRRLLSAPFAYVTTTGTLQVTGDASANDISVALQSNGMVHVDVDGNVSEFDLASVRRVNITAGDGDDTVIVTTPRRATILGGAGNDTLTGGKADDSLDGGAGNDLLDGAEGNDTLAGGDGYDIADYRNRPAGFAFSFSSLDEFGNQVSTVDPAESDGYSTASSTALGETDTIGYFIEQFNGTEFADTFGVAGGFSGPTRKGDLKGGDDTYLGATQGSAICDGGAGNDTFNLIEFGVETLFGGEGDDLVLGSIDNNLPNSFDAGSGADTLNTIADVSALAIDMNDYPGLENVIVDPEHSASVIGNALDNRIEVSYGNQRVTFRGGDGNDTLIGGAGDDVLNGDAGNDVISAGGGTNTVHGGNGNDTLTGGASNERLYGEAGDDLLLGRAGADRLYGGAGIDLFSGGSGNDFLSARDGIAESLYGGTGNDTADADEGLDELFSVTG